MYVILQTTQAPLQFNWCGDGLGQTAAGLYRIANTSATNNNVYISQTGDSPSVYTNQKGTLSYTFVKSGKTSGTTTGTANSSTYFTDSTATATGTTNYTLTIIDSNTGQNYVFLNSIAWGAI
jgi:hypothetical protein